MFRLLYQRLLRSNLRNYYTVNSNDKIRKEFTLTKQLYTRIKATGPITIADYMNEILTNPSSGYYTKKPNIFGQHGDFITSPELTQMFGEMIAIWLLNEWTKFGTPKPIKIIELGPGNGHLIQDILHVFKHFNSLKHVESVNLIEISPILSEQQAQRLCLQQSINNVDDNESLNYRQGFSHDGVPIRWYYRLDDLPYGHFTLIIANEFFDALPIHKFQRIDDGTYREILIDIDNDTNQFRYVLSNYETPISKLLINKDEQRRHLEISPDSLIVIKQITKRIVQDGGLCLISDYGYCNNEKGDTFRAFKQHQLHNPLIEPGTADLTADVDFQRLKQTIIESVDDVITVGPIKQRKFLINMGINERFKRLKELETTSTEQLKQLEFSLDYLLDPQKMGDCFKFFAIVPGTVKKIIEKYPLAGF